ncbi:MAG: hypothetical protein AUK25_14385 [Desulfobacteraceae bacterium CG2_30_51_40]|nr:MAG: hypothetical protein AUK25_14385 [Desulfobacteraceae bacterium CG2_30_51_40]
MSPYRTISKHQPIPASFTARVLKTMLVKKRFILKLYTKTIKAFFALNDRPEIFHKASSQINYCKICFGEMV